jgi:hypothetical protein
MAGFRRFAGTRRVHLGAGGHSRARATSRDTVWNVLELVVVEAHAPVVAFARRTGLLDVLREDHVYPTVDAAVRGLERRNVAAPAPQ